MPAPFEGGCRCRAIRYRCTGEPVVVLNCYCRDCQYSSGGACSTALLVNADDVTIEGSPLSFDSKADSGAEVSRLFCRTCGSPVFAKNALYPSFLAIKAATLDEPSWLKPAAHIWTRSAPPWIQLADDLPKFPGNFGSM